MTSSNKLIHPPFSVPVIDAQGRFNLVWQDWVNRIQKTQSSDSAVTLHNDLGGRSELDAHPIESITGLLAILQSYSNQLIELGNTDINLQDQINVLSDQLQSLILQYNATRIQVATNTSSINALDIRVSNIETDLVGIPRNFVDLNDVDATGATEGSIPMLDAFGIYKPFNLNEVFSATKDPSGFEANDAFTVTYNGTNRTVTITTTNPQIYYWYRGIRKTLGTNTWTSTAHANTAGNWYLYSTDGVTFSWSNTIWEFDKIMVLGVRYVNATKYIALKETHGLMPWETHRTSHLGIGTIRSNTTATGGTIGGFVLGSTATADRRPSATSVDLLDEDILTTVPALTDGGAYSHLFLSSATATDYNLNTEVEIVRMSGVNAQYQSPTTAVWSNIGNNNYANIYLIAIPATSDTIAQYGRWLWFQPQAVYANLSLAKAESFEDLNRADLINAFAEFLPVAKVTIKAVATNFSIESVEQIYGSRAGASGVPSATVTTASAVSFVPSGGLSSTDVQSALTELDSEKAPLSHTQAWSTITSTPTTLAGYGITNALNTSSTAQTKAGTLSSSFDSDGVRFAATDTRINADVTVRNDMYNVSVGATGYTINLLHRVSPNTDKGFDYGVVSSISYANNHKFCIKPWSGTRADASHLADAKGIEITNNGGLKIMDTFTSEAYLDVGTATVSKFKVNDTNIQSLVVHEVPNATADTHALNRITADGRFAQLSHTQAWSTITSTPTTLAGYGITDALGTSGNQQITGTLAVGFSLGDAGDDLALGIFPSGGSFLNAGFGRYKVGTNYLGRTYVAELDATTLNRLGTDGWIGKKAGSTNAELETSGKIHTKGISDSLKIESIASSSSRAGFNVPHGTAPTSPVNGDVWTTTAGMFVRINGVTKSINLT